jgi:hypothetical protein
VPSRQPLRQQLQRGDDLGDLSLVISPERVRDDVSSTGTDAQEQLWQIHIKDDTSELMRLEVGASGASTSNGTPFCA